MKRCGATKSWKVVLGSKQIYFSLERKKHRGGFVGSGSDANSANSGPLADKFHFPRATPLKLRLATVHLVELACLPLYSELVWLLDFSICALFVFFINEIVLGLRQISISVYNATVNGHNSGGASGFFLVHSFFSPSTINVSLVWCAFLVWFSLAALFSTFCIYIHPRSSEANNGEETTERRKNGVNGAGNSNDASSHTEAVSEWPLLLTTAFCSFVAAMFCISMDGRCFDLQLYSAYGNLSFSGGQVASSTLSWGMFQSTLALMAALIGMLFAFPGLQAGRVYLEAIKTSDSILTRVLFHLNFIAPFFALLLWVSPVVSQISPTLLQSAQTNLHRFGPRWTSLAVIVARIFSAENICSLRLATCVLVLCLRLFMTRRHMQAYLGTAQSRIDKLNNEPGRISNFEVQRLVASVFHCFNFAALQYLAPAILTVGLICSYKTTTGTPWFPLGLTTSPGLASSSVSVRQHSLNSVLALFSQHDWDSISTAPWFAAVQETREAFSEILDSLRYPAWHACHGILGFLLWWTLASWQAITSTGMAYYRFLD
ncbi:unnamed protein product [Schistocephalus solidus]|uniref:Transmembrane protein n=2 Tax=Schistocephalus solidus TaxID=70667 RepID=A0A183SLR1_SCHSO|nr:unnamed protein product [Schistocephalus solidus]